MLAKKEGHISPISEQIGPNSSQELPRLNIDHLCVLRRESITFENLFFICRVRLVKLNSVAMP